MVVQTGTVSTAAELTAGNLSWTDYTVSVAVKVPDGTATFGILGRWHDFNDTYMLLLQDGTKWQLAKRVNGTFSELRLRKLRSGAGAWHTLQLTFSGAAITAAIDGTTVQSAKDHSLTSGEVGFHTLGTPEYDSVMVTLPNVTSTATPTGAPAATPVPTTATPAATIPLTAAASSTAIGADGGSGGDRMPRRRVAAR